MTARFSVLLDRMRELKDLAGVIGLCTWDQETYLPKRADQARAAQLATLQGLYHERLVDPALGALLEEASASAERLDGDAQAGDVQAMVRVLKLERDRAVKVPSGLVRALAEAQSQALGMWRQARKARDFRLFLPGLTRLVELRREQADAQGHDGERYDALLEGYEPGMRVDRLGPVLTRLKERLVPWVDVLSQARPRVAPFSFDGIRFDAERQWALTLEILGDMGFDLDAGRQDRSIHPFTGGTHPHDVRLTTRIFEDNPLSALFSTIHEGGHGLYEQNFSEAHHRTPLAAAPSMGLHESQSRLWENLVGRSRPYWTHLFPRFVRAFPAQLEGVSFDAFFAAVNRVSRSPIRVEADEVTYNLHIVLRYELELLLVRDDLPLADLPSEWNRRTEQLLGFTPKDDLEGVLQDIHWAWGEFGYFPTYALGNLYAASLYAAAGRALPDLEAQLSLGQLRPLQRWLGEHVHQHGYRSSAEERVKAITGAGLTDEDFLHHLQAKYGELYGLSLVR